MLPVPAYIFDLASQTVLATNSKFASLLGYRRDELARARIGNVPHSLDSWRDCMLVEPFPRYSIESSYERGDGKIIRVTLHHRCMWYVPEGGGNPIAACIVFVIDPRSTSELDSIVDLDPAVNHSGPELPL
jgi:hypothetical protein